ncbi:uncharacterized protein [Maniola hyperantus]|uniref:uncharacterized protein isoform X2 n=1 Tax=Aphantopus hyperantus TaxID=2795564 RepID=UPI003747FF30
MSDGIRRFLWHFFINLASHSSSWFCESIVILKHKMKILFGFQALVGIYFLYEGSLVSGQYAEDVTKNFVPLTFPQVHRGSFNISNCVRELLNCWEVIKPDLVCTGALIFESVCGVLRHQCTDAEYWVSPLLAPIHEGFCDRL